MQPVVQFTTGAQPCPKSPEEIMNIAGALHWALQFVFDSDCVLNAATQKMFDKSSLILTQARFVEDDSPVDYSVEHRSGEFKSLAEIFHKNGNVVDVEDGKRLQRHNESADGKIFRRDVAAGPQEVIDAAKECGV